MGRRKGNDFALKDGFRMYHGSEVPGFPYYLHSGFETVTIAAEGVIDHSDSIGGAGRFKDGDVQWLTSGIGVQHSEMFPLLNQDKDNPFELFQIWLNLSAKSKKVDPFYKMLWSEDIPEVWVKDNAGKSTRINVITGKFNEVRALDPTPNSWAADPENHVAIWRIHLEAGASLTLPKAPASAHRNLYFYQGSTITIDGQTVEQNTRIVLHADHSTTITNGDQEAHLLLLQGKPIGEPVVQYGPFVANTQQELQETISLFKRTQFGGWPWPMQEQVWDRSKGRFAKYEDGTEELR